ncbi:MAG: DNA-directed RNA polymerase subunit beta [Bdellovibrionaceae bacterium]|nr:DNA-directed RNA polymerase subunit beta [Pseudobdellovibrionaceae bacterium]MDW8190080.1 DNA-directed RNA polymerase subunit beta [Pseudobdellovibrionaceae bacterium]
MERVSLTGSHLRLRRSFSKNRQPISIPNLIELQRRSYETFLQKDVDPDRRLDMGLQNVFRSVFPITDFNKTASLEFVSYSFEPPKYDVDECRQRGMTYEAALKVTLRLVVFDVDEQSDTRTIRDVKEQEIYLGTVPLMTNNGSFIISGVERVVVSQLHRSPGVFFDHDSGKVNLSGKLIYSARIIPYRGSWLDFEFDQKDLLHVRIDRRRKFPVTILLKALGYSTDQLLSYFYDVDEVVVRGDKFYRKLDIERMAGQRAVSDIVDPKTGEVIVKGGRRITRAVVKKIQQLNLQEIEVTMEDLIAGGRVLARPIINEETGEILIDSNTELEKQHILEIKKLGIQKFDVIFLDGLTVGPYLRNTLLIDKVASRDEALLKIFQHMRPGEPPSIETAKAYFHRLFFDPETYDLSEVGRVKINHKFNISFEECPLDHRVLTNKDILLTVKYLIDLKNGKGTIDDIDHLGNRRVRSVGELLENQFRIGLVRMERAIRERMSLQDIETMMPYDLVNAKPVTAVVKEFFASSQLSQFMDQTNPLSEITHKRRLSALGPGGLNRERAGFEVRDVHPTHYGRICPIETPEGANIGLISSLATFARINQYGFIETPYRKWKDGQLTDEIVYLSALEEANQMIAPAPRDLKQFIQDKSRVVCRKDGEYVLAERDQISLMDVSPAQLVSIAASLIPFLEHDDANRALMGSNMQRQAVPLIKARAPLVGTGVEKLVTRDSGTSVVAINDGVVEEVDASRIVVRRFAKGGELGANVDIYNLVKYQRTNQNTCFNQKPIVRKGDVVKRGDIIADGPSAELGELALGQNVIVAFMPWMGYNFEDSILISERLITDDVYTSIHIEEFECLARDTKLGKEEITRDIANVGEEALKDLDSSGIIRIGATVRPGSILVGKVTPKGESQLSPEEKLLRAIFGDKAGDVRDTSLRADPGVYGTVIDVQVYSRDGAERDPRMLEIIAEKKKKLEKDLLIEQNVIRNNALEKLKGILVGKKTTGVLLSEDGSQKLLSKGQEITASDLETIPFDLLMYIPLEPELEYQVTRIIDGARNQLDATRMIYEEKIERLKKGDELPAGVVKMVKVYIAIKRKLQVGDKFAGRHGNKGVVSKVLPVEDMPFLADGTPVDMVLNPLGVPSRMNIGQILEVHLGWAARNLGAQIAEVLEKWDAEEARRRLKSVFTDAESVKKIDSADEKSLRAMVEKVKDGVHVETPVFDGALESDVKGLLRQCQLDESGQTILFDGRTGEPFRNPVTVGVMYMLKLHHLVEEKIHARSIGPYSLVSQQPLGGKSQFGGQRLGEMEVWAIEAYGAAYSLQEFLTVKSDDVAGRTRMFESIVRGENLLEPGLPEAFNVLVNELKALALNVELIESDQLSDPVDEESDDGGLDPQSLEKH